MDGDVVDLSRWGQIPILERAEAAANEASMRSPPLADSYGDVSEIETSGTSGIPLKFAVSELVDLTANAALTRLARWHGADISRPLAVIRRFAQNAPPYPEGATAKGWSRADRSAPMYSLDFMTPVDRQLEWLGRRKAPYLLTSPSNAMALAYAATPAQARALGIEIIFSTAETVLPMAREVVADRFGARLIAIYSCQEVGYIAIECPVETHYHLMAENVITEIVDEGGRPAAPGQIGRVLVTGLFNYATPFIRYAVGDVAVASDQPCRCGRSLPVIEQVEGRTRCAFLFKDGTRKWPRSWDARALKAFVPFREFQMIQVDHEKIEFRYVADGSGRRADIAGLRAHAKAQIHPSVDMHAVEMSAIPRGPGGKLEHFVSLVSGGSRVFPAR
jgi:phenylacetate-CoA ligase